MQSLFEYNWQVRDEWLKWCESIPEQELFAKRTGGVQGILATLVHIIDVEYSWLLALEGKETVEYTILEYNSLEKVRTLSNKVTAKVRALLNVVLAKNPSEKIKVPWRDEACSRAEIINHCIVHEIHHIGQLSIWAREIGQESVSANFIGRKIL
ncbi:damage-inducible protein DinB [Niallia circulans]|uniref:Damage-inducible protein DinB n=1 Tax=Niallia circulans TaxID=1397 RepID=A0A553SN76_NIACI|nr:DinB family protein [Niallia circulans]TRZ38451.1 damage-inducible protein DinB [Niallia circulans]